MLDKLPKFEARLEVLERKLMDPQVLRSGDLLQKYARESAQVRKIVEQGQDLVRVTQELEEAKEMLAAEDDPELCEMARDEMRSLEAQLETGMAELRLLLLPRDPYEGRPLLLEIRAGTGGDEAALFASDLCRMYTKFGEQNGLRITMMSASTILVGGTGKTHQGFREAVLSVTGDKAYNLLRFEAGVHRVQRVPATESQGRIHTSAATVAVLPEPDAVEVKLDPNELRIDTMRAGGPGGQSVNTTDSAVRIVHIPTGLTVQCQDEKSQHKNRDKAMRVLAARLLELRRAEQHAKESAARKEMVGSGDRSERIRTYNYPQNRMTDHRIGLTLYKLDSILEGNLQEMVDGLTATHQTALLEAEGLGPS